MPAIVTDQFRILNASNFVESVESEKNSYYVFIGLSNPTGTPSPSVQVGYGRSSDWNKTNSTPKPLDSFSLKNIKERIATKIGAELTIIVAFDTDVIPIL